MGSSDSGTRENGFRSALPLKSSFSSIDDLGARKHLRRRRARWASATFNLRNIFSFPAAEEEEDARRPFFGVKENSLLSRGFSPVSLGDDRHSDPLALQSTPSSTVYGREDRESEAQRCSNHQRPNEEFERS